MAEMVTQEIYCIFQSMLSQWDSMSWKEKRVSLLYLCQNTSAKEFPLDLRVSMIRELGLDDMHQVLEMHKIHKLTIEEFFELMQRFGFFGAYSKTTLPASASDFKLFFVEWEELSRLYLGKLFNEFLVRQFLIVLEAELIKGTDVKELFGLGAQCLKFSGMRAQKLLNLILPCNHEAKKLAILEIRRISSQL